MAASGGLYLVPETVARMAAAAGAFIGGLDGDQRSVLNNPF
jgi:hypothetical protein